MFKFVLGYACGVGTMVAIGLNADDLSAKLDQLSKKLDEMSKSESPQT